MPNDKPIKVAILDDYQGVALKLADWAVLKGKADIKVFRDHLSDLAALVERLRPFDIVCVMRERTPFSRTLLEQLPNLKLLTSTGRATPQSTWTPRTNEASRSAARDTRRTERLN